MPPRPAAWQALEDADLEPLDVDDALVEKPDEEPPEDLGEVNTKAFIKVLCKGTRHSLSRKSLLILFATEAMKANQEEVMPFGIRSVTKTGPFHLYTTEECAKAICVLPHAMSPSLVI